MRISSAVITFIEKSAGISGLSEQDLLKLADPAINTAIRARLAAVAPAATKKLADNQWFPLPSQRTEAPPWHTLIGSTIYYLVEAAIAEHGIDNAVAGLLEAMLLPAVSTGVLGIAPVAGGEQAFLTAISTAIANAICPA